MTYEPLSDAELDECRKIEGGTPTGSVRIGTPYVVIQRLLATIDAQRVELDATAADRDYWLHRVMIRMG